VNQPVVRAKIPGMVSRAKAIQASSENITYQMYNMVRVSERKQEDLFRGVL